MSITKAEADYFAQEHVHTVDDGRGAREVYLDGVKVDYAIFADTKLGLVVSHFQPLKVVPGTGKIQVLDNPCLAWNVASAVMEADAQENRCFSKRKRTGRIDGAVALAMAVGAAEQRTVTQNLDDFLNRPMSM